MTEPPPAPEPPGKPPHLWARASELANNVDARAWRAVAASLLMVLLVGALLVVGRLYYGDEIKRFVEATLGQAEAGHWGLVATVLVFTLTAYVGAPQFVLIGACVVAFGPEVGFWYSWLATVISGAATYYTGRLSSAQTLKRFGGATGGRFTRFMGKNAFLASLIVRFLPTAPFVVVNVAFGAARINFVAFILGLALGVLPKTAMIAFAGDSIMDAIEGNLGSAALMAVAAIALWIVVTVIVRRLVRRGEAANAQVECEDNAGST